MSGGVSIQQVYSLNQISLPLDVTITKTGHQFGEVVPINPIMLEDAIDQAHQPHPTPLEVIQRTV